MQAAADEKIDVLEQKMDKGFADARTDSTTLQTTILSGERALREEILAVRNDARADFRTMLAVVFGMWTTTALVVIGVLFERA
jgi:hypothetical protein